MVMGTDSNDNRQGYNWTVLCYGRDSRPIQALTEFWPQHHPL